MLPCNVNHPCKQIAPAPGCSDPQGMHAGYTYSGSLFQGTGFWTHTTDITTARSDLGAVTVGTQVLPLCHPLPYTDTQ